MYYLIEFIIRVVYRSLIDEAILTKLPFVLDEPGLFSPGEYTSLGGSLQRSVSPGRARSFSPGDHYTASVAPSYRVCLRHLQAAFAQEQAESIRLLLLPPLCEVSFNYIRYTIILQYMRPGKEHARPNQPAIPVDEPRASGSGPRGDSAQQVISRSSETQPSNPDGHGGHSSPPGTPAESDSGIYKDILISCNTLVEQYRKGEISKPSAYVEIRSRLVNALGDDRARTDAAFGSFITSIENHDAEICAAEKRGRVFDPEQRSPSPLVSVPDEQQSEGEPSAKRVKVDESAFAWDKGRQEKRTVLRDTLAKTLRLIEAYTTDPKATKKSLVNQPDCPEFPDSEWKNIISGRAVNLDSVLSGQLSITQDDPKVEKVGDLEITFGAVEPTKLVKNGGDWNIAWNRTVRATLYAFPHRAAELSSYGEYIVNLFSVTHPSVHSRVIAFDKAVRKRVGGVRNLELWDYEKFADLKIAHMDSIGVSVVAGSSKDDGNRKGKRGKNWKKDEPCNKWNDGKCIQEEEECRRMHVCNKCRKAGHKGKDCTK